jgi:hypothetical protein
LITRGRRAAIAVVTILVLAAPAACTTKLGAPAGSTPHSAPPPSASSVASSASIPPSPAALAGGACLLMDFGTVAKQLGITFTVSAAADSSGTYTCVLQESSGTYPNLVLSITATDLSAADFKANVAPTGSTSVPELGKIAYQLQVPATKSAGPAVEIGWLSGNNRLIVFRYTFPTGTGADVATALGPKMVNLSQIVDQTTG